MTTAFKSGRAIVTARLIATLHESVRTIKVVFLNSLVIASNDSARLIFSQGGFGRPWLHFICELT